MKKKIIFLFMAVFIIVGVFCFYKYENYKYLKSESFGDKLSFFGLHLSARTYAYYQPPKTIHDVYTYMLLNDEEDRVDVLKKIFHKRNIYYDYNEKFGSVRLIAKSKFFNNASTKLYDIEKLKFSDYLLSNCEIVLLSLPNLKFDSLEEFHTTTLIDKKGLLIDNDSLVKELKNNIFSFLDEKDKIKDFDSLSLENSNRYLIHCKKSDSKLKCELLFSSQNYEKEEFGKFENALSNYISPYIEGTNIYEFYVPICLRNKYKNGKILIANTLSVFNL